jgi:predicted small lipoprotein YifL
MKKFLLITSMVLLLSACGRKGGLMPPEALVPGPVRNLNVMQTGQDFRITWRAPVKEEGGRPLKDLSGFQLLRRIVTPEGGECASCPDSWKLLTRVDLDLPETYRKSGDLFLYFDRVAKGGDLVHYRITAFSKSGGVSKPADAPLKKQLLPPPPPSLAVTLQPASIKVECTPKGATKPSPVGFNVYRRSAEAAPPLLPLNQEPVTGSTWEDQSLEYGRSYRYSATVVTQIEGELVESARSAEIEILFILQELR